MSTTSTKFNRQHFINSKASVKLVRFSEVFKSNLASVNRRRELKVLFAYVLGVEGNYSFRIAERE